MKLYEIPLEYDRLAELLIEACGELSPELEVAWKTLQVDSVAKVDAALCVDASMKASSEALANEIGRLQARKESVDKAKERLRAMILPAVQALGNKVKTDKFTASAQTRKNQNIVMTIDADIWELPANYYRVRDPELCKDAIKADIKNGKEMPKQLVITETETTFLTVR
jgi:hypothetical protein